MQRTITIVGTMTAAVLAVTGNAAAAQYDAAGNSQPTDRSTLAIYQKSGGFAGVDDKVIVDDDGTAHIIRQTTWNVRLTDDELSTLRSSLNDVWTWWSSSAGCEIADHFTYALTHGDRHATRCHAVPRDWQPTVDRFEALLNTTAPNR